MRIAIRKNIIASLDIMVGKVGIIPGRTELFPCDDFVLVAIYHIPALEPILVVYLWLGFWFSWLGIRICWLIAAIVDDSIRIGP